MSSRQPSSKRTSNSPYPPLPRFSGTRPRVPGHVKGANIQVPRAVAAAAARALHAIDMGESGGTRVGIDMARILTRHRVVPVWVPLKVAQYFPRHQHDRGVIERRRPGWIAWLLWGGYDGWSWGQSTMAWVERMNKERM